MPPAAAQLFAIFGGLVLFAQTARPTSLTASSEGATADAESARATLHEAMRAGQFQSDLPFGPAAAPAEPRRPRSIPAAPTPLRAILEVFAWAILCAVLVVIVVALFRVLTGRSGSSLGDGTASRDAKSVARRVGLSPGTDGEAQDYLGRAEKAAASGRYSEAAHLMLLGAISHLSKTAGLACRESATSRELAGAYHAEPERRLALNRLVEVVERALFGGRSLSREQFDQCRTWLQTLLRGKSP